MADDAAALSEEVKAAGRALAHRLAEEPGYAEEFCADPEAAMTAAGLPEDVMGDFTVAFKAAVEGEDEVEGFEFPPTIGPPQTAWPCFTFTSNCKFTNCRAPTPPPVALSAACSLKNWYS